MKLKAIGPFGLGSKIIIEAKGKQDTKHLTLAPVLLHKGEFKWVDESSKSSFKKGTIGHINGIGKTSHEISLDTPVEDIATLFK